MKCDDCLKRDAEFEVETIVNVLNGLGYARVSHIKLCKVCLYQMLVSCKISRYDKISKLEG